MIIYGWIDDFLTMFKNRHDRNWEGNDGYYNRKWSNFIGDLKLTSFLVLVIGGFILFVINLGK
jgi:hypothetical protein